MRINTIWILANWHSYLSFKYKTYTTLIAVWLKMRTAKNMQQSALFDLHNQL